jgi:hypothetical protein
MPLLLSCLLALAVGPLAEPVAMVLRAGPGATLRRGTAARPLRDMDLLLPGDRLDGGKGGASLVVLSDGHFEQLLPGRSATLGKGGCAPPDAVKVQKRKLSAVNLKRLTNLARLAQKGRGAVGIIRDREPDAPARVVPIHQSVVLSRRPALAWPAVPGAVGYDVRLYVGSAADRRLVWKASPKEPRLSYPAKSDLAFGDRCYWEVTARLPGDGEKVVVRSEFLVLASTSHERLAEVRRLAAGEGPDDWLLAAAAYEAYGALDEALALYEKLARARPEQANYRRALAYYYARAGLTEKAEAARAAARKLGAELVGE